MDFVQLNYKTQERQFTEQLSINKHKTMYLLSRTTCLSCINYHKQMIVVICSKPVLPMDTTSLVTGVIFVTIRTSSSTSRPELIVIGYFSKILLWFNIPNMIGIKLSMRRVLPLPDCLIDFLQTQVWLWPYWWTWTIRCSIYLLL